MSELSTQELELQEKKIELLQECLQHMKKQTSLLENIVTQAKEKN